MKLHRTTLPASSLQDLSLIALDKTLQRAELASNASLCASIAREYQRRMQYANGRHAALHRDVTAMLQERASGKLLWTCSHQTTDEQRNLDAGL